MREPHGGAKAGGSRAGKPAKKAAPEITDKKLRAALAASEKLSTDAARNATKTGQWLLPAEPGFIEAEGMERTYRFSQEALVGAADATAARKAFDLTLPALGPYVCDYTANGRHLLLGGRRGHLALVDWARPRLVTEIQVRETTRAVKFLHNSNFFAAAQEKYVYIYDKRGLEVHCLREHEAPLALEFLPRFFMLASVGEAGALRYQDTSTGEIVAQHRTRLGRCEVLRGSPTSGVLLAGHGNGTVTLWSPNMGTPLASLLSHRGAVRSLAVDVTGRYLVTGGQDCQVRVWDVRTFRPLHAYFSAQPASALDVSQRGMLAVGYGPHVQVWAGALGEKAKSPYLNHLVAGGGCAVAAARFCPYDDVLGVGHAAGFASLLVPGAGEPNYDSFVANPYETKKQAQEAEVHALLDKLPASMIGLDPDSTVGGIVREPREVQLQRRREAAEAETAARLAQHQATDEKKKMKGRRKPSMRHRRKQLNVIDERRLAQLAAQKGGEKGGADGGAAKAAAPEAAAAEAVPLALRRFLRK